jgi:serine/threonine protein phosphatase PrpC
MRTAFLIDDNLGLYAVADGIGGLDWGAFASEMALGRIQRLLADKVPTPMGLRGEDKEGDKGLKRSFEEDMGGSILVPPRS